MSMNPQEIETPTTALLEKNLNKIFTVAQAVSKLKHLIEPTITEKQTTFSIIMANDVYELAPDYNGMGGLAELATLMKAEKQKCKNSIVTLNGDFLSASALAQKYQGSHMVDIFNKMPIEYVVLGNHEFDFGAEVLRQRIKEGNNFEWFASNIIDTETGKIMEGCIAKKVLSFDDFKVGLFGVCTRSTTVLSKPGNSVQFLPVIETSRKIVHELRSVDNVDAVVAITHLSVMEDRELARQCPGIDVIVGGHDHTPHTQMQGNTFIHKAGHDGFYLARIDLSIEKKITQIKGKIFEKVKVFPAWSMILNRNTVPDPEVKAVVDHYLSQLPADTNQEIGLFESNIDSSTESVRSKENTMGNLVGDIVQSWFGSDLVVINGGTIRGDRQYDQGYRIKKGDMYKEFPFPTLIYKAQVTGAVFVEAIEQMISKAEGKPGCFPQLAHGIQIEYDVKLQPFQRIKSVLFKGKPLDLAATYTLASTDYLLGGGDGVSALKKAERLDHPMNGKPICDLVVDYIIEHNVVGSKKEGRISLIAKKPQKGSAEDDTVNF